MFKSRLLIPLLLIPTKNSMLRKLILFILSFITLFTFVKSTSAQEQSQWIINNFLSTISIEPTGIVQISETIEADFFIEKHGIFRNIPLNYFNNDGSKHFTNITVLSVIRNSKPEKFSTYKEGNDWIIKIGDPDKKISGRQIYTIYYSQKGILQNFNNYDELYWNVTGSQWPVDITSAKATISINNADILSTACYQGPTSSREYCNIDQGKKSTSFSTTKPLHYGNDFTVAVSYPTGIIPILSVTEQKTFSEKVIEFLILLNIFLIPVAPIITLIIIFLLWFRTGRDKVEGNKNKSIFFNRSIAAEFSPPDKLKPAEIGILFDQKADTLDITATIIDLAVRGYLQIKETKTKRSLLPDKTDYTLIKITPKNAKEKLIPYEKMLIDKLFKTKDKVELSSLKNTFYADLKSIKDQAYKDMASKAIFNSNPDKIRKKYLTIGFVLFFLGLFLMWWLSICGLIIIIFSRIMPSRTSYGFELYQRSKGYKEFIEKAQKYPQKFYEDNNLFNEVLPYAIMFGVVEKFANAAKEMGLKSNNNSWYTGPHHFNPILFSSNITNFSNSFSSTSASRPSSSGSGGGGFSGGGFGGGGGGSW